MGSDGGLFGLCKYGVSWAEVFGRKRRHDNDHKAFMKRVEKRRAKKKRKR